MTMQNSDFSKSILYIDILPIVHFNFISELHNKKVELDYTVEILSGLFTTGVLRV